MRNDFRQLRSKQLDRALAPLRSANVPRPPKGWIRAIREALGLSSAELAERMKANRSLIVQQEKAEADDWITLKSLRAFANALDCDLVYAFVPRGATIEQTLTMRARDEAAKTVGRVEHSMALEDQASGNVQQAVDAQVRRIRRSGKKP